MRAGAQAYAYERCLLASGSLRGFREAGDSLSLIAYSPARPPESKRMDRMMVNVVLMWVSLCLFVVCLRVLCVCVCMIPRFLDGGVKAPGLRATELEN